MLQAPAGAPPIVSDIFDQRPVAEQPGVIADVGCGNGGLACRAVLRGPRPHGARGGPGPLPLLMVGVDAGPHAVLFHDPNRAVRARWLRLLAGAPAAPHLAPIVERARAYATPEARRRANRRILPEPHDAGALVDVLRTRFAGGISRSCFEILPSESLDALIVPSNMDEYLPEVTDRADRETVIRTLMSEVLPALRRGAGGTSLDLSLMWTFGEFVRG